MQQHTLLLLLVVAVVVVSVVEGTTRPTLPQATVDTTYPSVAGTTRTVNSGDDLQAALDAAQPGDELVLQAGATWEGNFSLKAKNDPTKWIIIRTSAVSSLPNNDTRVTPNDAGNMPKIYANTNGNRALQTDAGANNYYFLGIEFGVKLSVTSVTGGLVALGSGGDAQYHVLDRCYVHGHGTANTQAGIRLNGRYQAVINSYISEIHSTTTDTQAIGGVDGPGPFLILNNYLEGAAENIMFGGGVAADASLVPSDITIIHNHFNKPLTWYVHSPTYAGTQWIVKNLFELKNAKRVLLDGNIFEYNFIGADQRGTAILLTVRDEGVMTWAAVQDVTFTNNIIRHAAGGVSIFGIDSISTQTARILFENNLFYDLDNLRWGNYTDGSSQEDWRGGRFLQSSGSTNKPPAKDQFYNHNTVLCSGPFSFADADTSFKHDFFSMTNNIFPRKAGCGQCGFTGSGSQGAEANTCLTNNFEANADLSFNAIFGGADPSKYPGNNNFPSSIDWAAVSDPFAQEPTGDPDNIMGFALSSMSPYKNAGSDGKDIGADLSAIEAAVAGVINGVYSPGQNNPPADGNNSGSSSTASSLSPFELFI